MEQQHADRVGRRVLLVPLVDAGDLVDSNLDRQPGFAQGPAKAFANEALDKLENMPEQRAEGAIIGMTTISNPAVPNQPASEHRHGVAVALSCMPA